MPTSISDPYRPRPERSTPIRASELAQFDFCQRAWWLGTVQQRPTDNQASLARGQRVHARHEDRVSAAARWRRAGYMLIGAGGILLIVTILWLLGAGSG